MILLTSTSDKLQLVTATGVSSIEVHASYIDLAGSTPTPGRLNSAISTATTTDIVAAPGSSVTRNIKALVIHNTHATSSCVVTLQHTDGTTVPNLFGPYTLLAGETIQYFDTLGFQVIDASGGLKLTPALGRILKVTIVNSGTTFTTSMGTNSLLARMLGGGGGGGGCGGANLGNQSYAGGGSAGGYTEVLSVVTPNTGYTYAIGGGGGGGVNSATGTAGGNTTLTIGASTWTAQGGAGGANMAAGAVAAGALGGAVTPANTANSPLLSCGGDAGGPSSRANGTVGTSGEGGSSLYGSGGSSLVHNAATTGTAGVGAANYGSGGSGAGGNSNATGGAGSTGMIMFEEYS